MNKQTDDAGWQWFETLTQGADHVQADLRDDFKSCFQNPAGQRVLLHLMDKTMGRALSGHVRPHLLTHLEGQRYLVKYILAQLQNELTQ